ncbi:hypothetical protein JCM8547_000047 [Rhodosporidiobolus lusitaniae]
MGRSAKLMKRPSKADREAKKINNQSKPRQQRSPSPDDSSAGPSAIPLFNSTVPGRAPSKPRPSAGAAAPRDMNDDEVEAGEPDLRIDDEDDEAAPAARKKGGLKEKAKAMKAQMKAEDDRKKGGKLGGKKGKPQHVLKGADYLKLHEKTPGKKRFR